MITGVSSAIFTRVPNAIESSNKHGGTGVAVSNNGVLNSRDADLQELTISASTIGAASAGVEGNKTFVKNLIDANSRGIGQLVDADLNEESAKLKALQTQEQLALQALGIANSSTQNILRMFE